jgi:hypothetical protein
MWEKKQLMLMQQHFAQLLHLPEIQKLQYLPSAGVVVAVVVATARCTLVATTIELN